MSADEPRVVGLPQTGASGGGAGPAGGETAGATTAALRGTLPLGLGLLPFFLLSGTGPSLSFCVRSAAGSPPVCIARVEARVSAVVAGPVVVTGGPPSWCLSFRLSPASGALRGWRCGDGLAHRFVCGCAG